MDEKQNPFLEYDQPLRLLEDQPISWWRMVFDVADELKLTPRMVLRQAVELYHETMLKPRSGRRWDGVSAEERKKIASRIARKRWSKKEPHEPHNEDVDSN